MFPCKFGGECVGCLCCKPGVKPLETAKELVPLGLGKKIIGRSRLGAPHSDEMAERRGTHGSRAQSPG